jgi:hypothetical protein
MQMKNQSCQSVSLKWAQPANASMRQHKNGLNQKNEMSGTGWRPDKYREDTRPRMAGQSTND